MIIYQFTQVSTSRLVRVERTVFDYASAEETLSARAPEQSLKNRSNVTSDKPCVKFSLTNLDVTTRNRYSTPILVYN